MIAIVASYAVSEAMTVAKAVAGVQAGGTAISIGAAREAIDGEVVIHEIA